MGNILKTKEEFFFRLPQFEKDLVWNFSGVLNITVRENERKRKNEEKTKSVTRNTNP